MVTGDSKWFNAMDGEQALPSIRRILTEAGP
jgi:hypothetical protein